jgi:hypothetical protein
VKRNDLVFLVAVAAFAVAFAAASLSSARGTGRGRAVLMGARGAGRAREVDARRIRSMIRGRYLSEREAEFYRKLPSRAEERPGRTDRLRGGRD